jgi:hypothetical protein
MVGLKPIQGMRYVHSSNIVHFPSSPLGGLNIWSLRFEVIAEVSEEILKILGALVQ